MALSALGAVAALVSAGSGVANSISAGNASTAARQQQAELTQQSLQDARNNQLQQQLIDALINQRSVAGSSDSFGTTLKYDPTTNTWVSSLGALPKAAQTAADQAGIRQNTTTERQAELANQQAMLRAARAAPAADTAQRDLTSFKPMGQDQLAGLLQNKSTIAANETFRPLVADTLRAFARSGTSAGPVLADIGRTQADNLRKSLIDSQIGAITNTNSINDSRRASLGQNAATTASLASPSFQQTGVVPSTASQQLANQLSARAATASTAPAFGQGGLNNASTQTQAALAAALKQAGTLPVDTGAAVGKDLGALGQNKDLVNTLQNLFGGGTNANQPFDFNRGLNPTPGTSPGFGDQLFNSGGVF